MHGYKDTFRPTHRQRRQVLYVASNDGAIHAFDAGSWDPDLDYNNDGYKDGGYSKGTGKELWAWVPRDVMPAFDNLASSDVHQWTVDGSPTTADVYIDFEYSSGPVDSDREWRSILLNGERRGGRSLVCLDITQPDKYDTNGAPVPGSGNDPSCATNTSGCNGAWPTLRWEFSDPGQLGQTWSRPLVAFVKVSENLTTDPDGEMRSVAIFGGGYEPVDDGVTGHFIYIVDIETGKTLYKQATDGMVPGEITAVDLNLDGFVEVLYWGDTAGYLYRMDVSDPGLLGAADASGWKKVLTTSWVVEKLFYAGAGRPFFHRPAVAVATYSSSAHPYFAVAIGSGNRAEVTASNGGVEQGFFVVLDKEDSTLVTTADLAAIAPEATAAAAGTNYFQTHKGFYIRLLSTDEKVNTNSIIVENYMIFSTFAPDPDALPPIPAPDPSATPVPTPTPTSGDVDCTECAIDNASCISGRNAKTYVVNFYNGNPLEGETSRYDQHDIGNVAMATDPVIYLGADGKLHILHQLDTMQISEVIPSSHPPLRITSWREN
jgi:Tfp pilus tip-associated adhesin PilY1